MGIGFTGYSVRSPTGMRNPRTAGKGRLGTLAICNVNKDKAAIWVVKALVEATPISGPARVISFNIDSRTNDDSGTLQMASVPR